MGLLAVLPFAASENSLVLDLNYVRSPKCLLGGITAKYRLPNGGEHPVSEHRSFSLPQVTDFPPYQVEQVR